MKIMSRKISRILHFYVSSCVFTSLPEHQRRLFFHFKQKTNMEGERDYFLRSRDNPLSVSPDLYIEISIFVESSASTFAGNNSQSLNDLLLQGKVSSCNRKPERNQILCRGNSKQDMFERTGSLWLCSVE